MLQFVDRNGHFAAETVRQVDRTHCEHLFTYMLLLRTFDEEVLKLQRAGRLLFCNPSTGEEAVQIGSAAALQSDDWVFPYYRTCGVYLYRKRSPLLLLHQLYGNARDLSRGTQLPMHFGDKEARYLSVSSPIGTQITQAVGLSIAAKVRGESSVAITYFGDGATSSNDFHGGLNLAGVLKTPTVFFCVNNQYALSVPVNKQTASATLAEKAAAYGMASFRVDGNDVLAVYDVTARAANHARQGRGPVLIEAVTYRLGLHSSSDNPALYRTSEEAESWSSADPIPRFRKFLEGKGWWSAEWEAAVRKQHLEQIHVAVAEAESAPPPEPASLFENVYSEPTLALRAQQRLLEEELAGR